MRTTFAFGVCWTFGIVAACGSVKETESDANPGGNDGAIATIDAGSSIDAGPNTAPPAPTVTITPENPTAADVLTCAGTAVDPDGDPLTYSYQWFLGDTVLGTSETLPAQSVTRGDEVRCDVVANDGRADSPVGSASALMQNAPPDDFVATVTPADAKAQSDELRCEGTTTDVDTQDGTLNYTTTWEWENYAGATEAWTRGVGNSGLANRQGDAVNPLNTVAGRRYRCTLTAIDGTNASTISTTSEWVSIDSPPNCPPWWQLRPNVCITGAGQHQQSFPQCLARCLHWNSWYRRSSAMVCESRQPLRRHNCWGLACGWIGLWPNHQLLRQMHPDGTRGCRWLAWCYQRLGGCSDLHVRRRVVGLIRSSQSASDLHNRAFVHWSVQCKQ
jgi:hypothetical protein